MRTLFAVAITTVLVGCGGTSALKPDAATQADARAQFEKEVCENTVCQRNVRVVLKSKSGPAYDRTFDVMPGIVQPIGVTVLAGQTVNVEAQIENGKVTFLRAVDVVVNPETTITAAFKQMDDGGMMLSVRNPFSTAIKFNMAIMPLDKEDLYKTSSCPVMAKGGSYEMWPEPLFQVLLTNGRSISTDSGMSCVY